MQPLFIRLPADIHTNFKIVCASQNKPMNDIAIELIREYILKKKAIA